MKELSYKNKNRILLLGTALFALIFYFAVLNKTISLISSCKGAEKRLEGVNEMTMRSAEMKAKLLQFSRALGVQQKSESDAQQQLLSVVTRFCQENNIVLREYPQVLHSDEKGMKLITNTFVIEGDFTRLLKLVYVLEQKEKAGKLVSVKFFTKKDFKTNTNALLATLYIQNVNRHDKKES